jgi:hypothetical protein
MSWKPILMGLGGGGALATSVLVPLLAAKRRAVAAQASTHAQRAPRSEKTAADYVASGERSVAAAERGVQERNVGYFLNALRSTEHDLAKASLLLQSGRNAPMETRLSRLQQELVRVQRMATPRLTFR